MSESVPPDDTTGQLLSCARAYLQCGVRMPPRWVIPRRDTHAEAAASDLILRTGEPFYETDTHAWYVGDGISGCQALPIIGYAPRMTDVLATVEAEHKERWEQRISPKRRWFGKREAA